MICENIFCIYQSDNACMLEEIRLDIAGVCADCIYVDISLEKLKELKENQLRDIESR